MQNEFVTVVARGAPTDWERILIHYENYLHEADELFEQSTSNVWIGGNKSHLELSLDAIDILVGLKEEMAKSATNTWTWVEIEIQSSGKYSFDYKYGLPPLTAQSLQRTSVWREK